jgi:hypothetical protein
MSEISKSPMGEHFSQEFMARLDQCTTPDEVAALFRTQAVESGYATQPPSWRDDPSILVPTGKTPTISRTITVGNQSYEIEAANEEGLKEIELELYRRSFTTQPQQQPSQQSRDSQGRFTAQEQQQTEQEQNQMVDLEQARLAHLSGNLSDREFADVVLAHQGIDADKLREVVQERDDAKFVEEWRQATEEFLSSVEAADYPGGERNSEILQEILIKSGLSEVEPNQRANALGQCYLYAKEHGLLVENEETAARDALENAQTRDELDRALDAYRTHPKDSGFFGR